MVVRAACGGYGDGRTIIAVGIGDIPTGVVAPSTPADAGALMLTALQHDGPIVYLEHKLLSGYWLELLGSGGRTTVSYDVPAEGANGPVPDTWEPLPLGKAVTRREGSDITMVSIAVGVHRCLEAASALEKESVSAGVIDLRSISPLDGKALCEAVSKSGRVLVVDEDYRDFGLSGEVAAILLEAGLTFKYGRVCTEDTIPYSRDLEDAALPNTGRIIEAARKLL
jgi:pyruvate dehydrogenase E1 component beta subunit